MYICIKAALLGRFREKNPVYPDFQKISACKSCKLVRNLRKLDVLGEN